MMSADPEERSRVGAAADGQVFEGMGQTTSTPQVRHTVPQHAPPGQLEAEQGALVTQLCVAGSQISPPEQSVLVAQARAGAGATPDEPPPQAASAAASASAPGTKQVLAVRMDPSPERGPSIHRQRNAGAGRVV
jgi:hypothetical protein